MKKKLFVLLLSICYCYSVSAQENVLYHELKEKFVAKFKENSSADYSMYVLQSSAVELFTMQNKKFITEAQKIYNQHESDSAVISILAAKAIDSFLKEDFGKIICTDKNVSEEGVVYYADVVCAEYNLLKEQGKKNANLNTVKKVIAKVTNDEQHINEMRKLFRVSHEYLDTDEINKCTTAKLYAACADIRKLVTEQITGVILEENKGRVNYRINEMLSNISGGIQHKMIDHLNFNFTDKVVFQQFKSNIGSVEKEIDELIASSENSFYAYKNSDMVTQTFMVQPNSNKPQIKFQIVYKVIEKLGETLITQTEFIRASDIKNQKELIRRFKENR